jgi:predicted nucleic acid-binding protein
LARSLGLHQGELAALAFMYQHPNAIFLTDDAAARLAAKSMGLRVHGTIAVLLRSLRTGKRTRDELLRILNVLPERSTLHIRRSLLNEVIDELTSDAGR